jgi:hypothetical protein
MNNDITILVQGPLRNNLLKSCLPSYIKFSSVVFVCYETENLQDFVGIPNLTLLKVKEPPTNQTFNYNNTFLQTFGILQGLKSIKTEYTIRVRSDESFPVLDTFISNLKKYPDKIHVTNLYSFKDSEHKYCLGNHIFAGRTKTLLKATEWAYRVCKYEVPEEVEQDGQILNYIDKHSNKIPMWSEILQTISFLRGLDIEIDSNNSRQQIIDNFYLTPLTDFPNFKWTHKYNNYQPITKDTKMEYDPCWRDSGSIPNRFLSKIEDV